MKQGFRGSYIPGLKIVIQVEEDAGAMRYGPLKDEEMKEITAWLG